MLAIVMVIQGTMIALAAWSHSPTGNEPGHLIAGLHHWHTGTTRMYWVNPPLVSMLATAPVLATRHQVDWVGDSEMPGARPEFLIGERFMQLNGMKGMTAFRIARLALLPIILLGTYLVYRWATSLSNPTGGLVAALLWGWHPLLLGSASLLTPDAVAAVAGIGAMMLIGKCDPRRLASVVPAACGIGLAIATKFTHLILVPIAICWIVIAFRRRLKDRKLATVGGIALLLSMVVLSLDLFYGFGETGRSLGDFQFVSNALGGHDKPANGDAAATGNRFSGTFLATLPVPVPVDFVYGIDLQRSDFEDYCFPSYLNGEIRDHGWWHYYLWVLMLKTPVSVVAMAAVLFCTWLMSAMRRDRSHPSQVSFHNPGLAYPMFCGVIYFVFVSSQTGINQHGRYILPCLPPLAVWAGAVFGRWTESLHQTRQRWATTGLAIWAAMLLAEVGLWTPHHLSMFNVFAGGLRGGPRYLLHSNIDWGQDLLRLRHWVDEQRKEADFPPVFAAAGDMYNPFVLLESHVRSWPKSMRAGVKEPQVPDGWYAITVNRLWGLPDSAYDESGLCCEIDPSPLERLRNANPSVVIGGSIRIFSAEQVREAYNPSTVP